MSEATGNDKTDVPVGGSAARGGGGPVAHAQADHDRPARTADGDAAGHARPARRGHGAAADRGRPGRRLAPVLGGDRVHTRLHDHHAVLRQARRHVRAEEVLHRRDHHLPRRVGAVRPVPVDGAADHVPRYPGPWRGRPDGRRDGDDRRYRAAPAARQVHELLHGRDDAGHDRRPAGGRVDNHRVLVAVDLLHQPAARRGRACLPDGDPAHARSPGGAPHRLPGRRPARRDRDVGHPGRHLGRHRVQLDLGPGPRR